MPYPTSSRETAYIIHPVLSGRPVGPALDEAAGLARAIDLDVIGTRVFKVAKMQAGTFLGKGQREMVAAEVEELKPHVVIFNHNLTPVQQRNLEKEWKVKVIERTGLILDIFGARAQTREGRLQVDLAALEYQKSRLVRLWTHLERQRGGAGFMGGPGETQIELDRRMISDKLVRLRKELEGVRRTRELGRKSRERVPFPSIALVGYTNAGKSTLFNRITGAGVFAEDLPFATLDPTLRRIKLPNGQEAILSDTVGFIADLPTHLVAAFRATLEQINHADVIAHVIDVSRPDHATQKQDVIAVLKDLGVEYEQDDRVIEIFNKADALPDEERQEQERKSRFADNSVLVSALTGQGVEVFLQKVAAIVSRERVEVSFLVPFDDGKAMAWLHSHAEVLAQENLDEGARITASISQADIGKFRENYGYAPVQAA